MNCFSLVLFDDFVFSSILNMFSVFFRVEETFETDTTEMALALCFLVEICKMETVCPGPRKVSQSLSQWNDQCAQFSSISCTPVIVRLPFLSHATREHLEIPKRRCCLWWSAFWQKCQNTTEYLRRSVAEDLFEWLRWIKFLNLLLALLSFMFLLA